MDLLMVKMRMLMSPRVKCSMLIVMEMGLVTETIPFMPVDCMKDWSTT